MNNPLATFVAVTLTTLAVWWLLGRPPTDLLNLMKVIGALTATLLLAQKAPEAITGILRAPLTHHPDG